MSNILNMSYTWQEKKSGKYRTRQGHTIVNLLRAKHADTTPELAQVTDLEILKGWISRTKIHKIHK